ncbi:hypothetical protein JKF63_02555 [Porcisia hertigi]|uniref:Uncharacterized protein n=1 Tax=Porcisia hertigi TaxID=2761500 RepID=A0A836HRF3_9TRYP|nr:hypothetical protein JKF63_02555 [Porcisia hertigi]
MAAVLEANNVDNSECYSDDFSQDEFEADNSSTAHSLVEGKENAGLDKRSSSDGFAASEESTPKRAYGDTISTTSSSSARMSSRSCHNSSVLHSLSQQPAQLTATANRGSPGSSHSSYTSSSFSSPNNSSIGASAHFTEDAVGSAHLYLPDSGLHKDDNSVLPADQVGEHPRRRADGCVSEPNSHSGTFSHDQRGARGSPLRATGYQNYSQRNCGSTNVSVTDRPQRPHCPETIEELRAMEEENERMRDELFQRSRQVYKVSVSQSTKLNSPSNRNRPFGVSGVSRKNTITSPTGGTSGRQRDVAARLVQESLRVHRNLQILRLQQRDLVQRRDELRELVSRYKKAIKYKDLVEAVKKDIAILMQDHRDAHLEVRCNEKLLTVNDTMGGSGVSDRKLQEEIRSQNALTQRQREHALRDADNALRVRDAAAQRVEELMLELENRRQWAMGDIQMEVHELHLMNHAKADRIHELRRQLRGLQEARTPDSDECASNSRQRHTPRRSRCKQHCNTQREDAERKYLEARIAEMRRELEAIKGGVREGENPRRASSDAEANPDRNKGTEKPSPPSNNPFLTVYPAVVQNEAGSAAVALRESSKSNSLAEVQKTAPPKRSIDKVDATSWMNADVKGEAAEDGLGYPSQSFHDADTAGSDFPREGASPAAHQAEGLQREHPHVAAASAVAQDGPPAWLGAEDDKDDGRVAPVEDHQAASPSSTYDPASDVEGEAIEEDWQDAHDEQAFEAATAPPHEEEELVDELFGDEGNDSAQPAAAPSTDAVDDDGPAWLNF